MKNLRRWLRQWWLCRTKQCTYFNHYLAYGPAELTHEGYHAAEKHCEHWQRRDQQWWRDHANSAAIASPYQHQCEVWERRVRA